jgi:hypothetical protein
MEAFTIIGSTLTGSPVLDGVVVVGMVTAASALKAVLFPKVTNDVDKAVIPAAVVIAPPAAVVPQRLPFAAAVPLVMAPLDLMARALVLADECIASFFNVQLDELSLGSEEQYPVTLRGFDLSDDPDKDGMCDLLVKIWNHKHNAGLKILQNGTAGVELLMRRLPRVLRQVGHIDQYAARADPVSVGVTTFAGVRVCHYGIRRMNGTTIKTGDSYFEFLLCRSDSIWPVAFAAIVFHACFKAGVFSDDQCRYMAIAKTIQCLGMSYGVPSSERFRDFTPADLGLPVVEFA